MRWTSFPLRIWFISFLFFYPPFSLSSPLLFFFFHLFINFKKKLSLETKEGTKKLFGWGRNKHGQVGITSSGAQALNHSEIERVLLPQELEFFRGDKIQYLAAGDEFSIVVTSKGLFGFGRGDFGQLITTPSKINNEPTNSIHPRGLLSPHLLISDEEFSQVSCGWGHVLAIDSSI